MRPRPFALERFFARHEFNARYLLSTSDCQGLAMAALLAGADAELRHRWEELRLGYTESRGLPELRQEIAGLYREARADDVVVAAPEEGIFLAMNALLQPGDHVVCTFPGYQSLYQLALSLGCDVTLWEPAEGGDWLFDPLQLRELVRPDTRLIVWNFPHNPTGALPSPEDLDKMLGVAGSVGAWVFSDEMYRFLEPSPEVRLPAAVDRYERAVSLSGMSKAFGLAGLRIGWIATRDPSLLEELQSLKDYTTICSSAPSELLALMALRSREAILRSHRDRLRRNTTTVADFFARHSTRFEWIAPRAGTVCFPRVLGSPARRAGKVEQGPGEPNHGGAESFCSRVLRDTGVLLLPSTVYGYGDAHFRLGLGREDFAEGLAVLDDYLESRDGQAG